ncbi:hypothetical protein tb265_40420 [Gemmatimonadetes bacterium T265]|nr:hypothetical protein tb265_40420 [Gemmatimonadetes bacterium T265]
MSGHSGRVGMLRRLLTVGTADDLGAVGLPVGGLEVEWEWSQWAEGFRPIAGDRISALGYHVIDCGHAINSEIHPPIAVAVQRPLPVLLPPTTALERGQPPVPIGTNVYVPGVITDVFVHLDGGDILACRDNSLHQSRRIPRNNPVGITTPCVAQPDGLGVPFTFHVYLPVNPQRIVRGLAGGSPPVPALYTAVVDAPEAPAGTGTSLPLQIVDTTHLDSDTPYVTVSVDISQLRAGARYAKRLVAAWVYPDIAGTNYGLRALRVGLDSLVVTDDGDGNLPFNGGDWRFWIGYANAVRPWTRVITCDGCVNRQTYTPSASVFRTGVLAPDGVFAGEILQFDLFPASTTRLRMTGYDQDTFGSDDVGEVDTYVGGTGRDVEYSSCNDNTAGTTGLNPSNSGCAGYVAYLNVTPGQTPVASTLSAQARAFLTRLLVGAPLLRNLPVVASPELYTPRVARRAGGRGPRGGTVSARVLPLTSHREVEGERWQDAFAPARLRGASDAFVAGLRTRVLAVLGAHPSAATRAKVRADLARVKASLPPALYQHHLCDLETGRPCALAR